MQDTNELRNFMREKKWLNSSHRPIRLKICHQQIHTDDILLPQLVTGTESVCGGFEYRVNCVATSFTLPLKEFIGLPASLEFVNDRRQLRKVNGLISQASAGDSDGAIASYQLVIRDAMAFMEQRINTSVFRRMSWPQIVTAVLKEWTQLNSALTGNFDFEFAPGFRLDRYPEREQTIQFNEPDAALVRRLLARSGIAWYFRPGRNRAWREENRAAEITSAHTLVLFDDQSDLTRNAAGVVRYHRDDATEERDSVTHWRAVRKFQPGSSSIFSWDYKQPGNVPRMFVETSSNADQGETGNALANGLQEFIVETPHVGADDRHLQRLSELRMQRKEFDTKHFTGEGSVRDFCAGQYFTIKDHPEIDRHSEPERDFVITSLEVRARNNLPKSLEERAHRLFACNGWHDVVAPLTAPTDNGGTFPFHMRFEAVRRCIPIVPSFDPGTDLPDPGLQIAVVVGGDQDVVHCDEYGRVKIRFPATCTTEDKGADSAWVRVATTWAGSSDSGCGTLTLPRVGTEVLVAFLGGDPDKPKICELKRRTAALKCWQKK